MDNHHAPRSISSLVLTCLTLSLLCAVVPKGAFAARDVTGYRPARVCPGGGAAPGTARPLPPLGPPICAVTVGVDQIRS